MWPVSCQMLPVFVLVPAYLLLSPGDGNFISHQSISQCICVNGSKERMADQNGEWQWDEFCRCREELGVSQKTGPDTDINDEELQTASIGVKSLINSRLLTALSDDWNNEPVLTPNHIPIGQMGEDFARKIVDNTAFNPQRRWVLELTWSTCLGCQIKEHLPDHFGSHWSEVALSSGEP